VTARNVHPFQTIARQALSLLSASRLASWTRISGRRYSRHLGSSAWSMRRPADSLSSLRVAAGELGADFWSAVLQARGSSARSTPPIGGLSLFSPRRSWRARRGFFRLATAHPLAIDNEPEGCGTMRAQQALSRRISAAVRSLSLLSASQLASSTRIFFRRGAPRWYASRRSALRSSAVDSAPWIGTR